MPSFAPPPLTMVGEPTRRVARGLDALNVFLADVRDGLGPYLAIYLLAVRGPEQGWNEGTTGLVITISAIRREGLAVSDGQFLLVGALVMPPALLLSLAVLALQPWHP